MKQKILYAHTPTNRIDLIAGKSDMSQKKYLLGNEKRAVWLLG